MTWIGSPNYSKGRLPYRKPSVIVIHHMAGFLAGADATFQNTKRQTSAHYGIENDTVHQYVRESDTAWHSNNWFMNRKSIGIEHSADVDRPPTAATYRTSGKLVAEICKRWGIPLDRKHIIKHSEVTPTQCPGLVNLDRIIAEAKKYLTNEDEFMGVSAKNYSAEATRGYIFEFTGGFHSLADVRKNHLGKNRAQIRSSKGFQTERRVMLKRFGLTDAEIKKHNNLNKRFIDVIFAAGR